MLAVYRDKGLECVGVAQLTPGKGAKLGLLAAHS